MTSEINVQRAELRRIPSFWQLAGVAVSLCFVSGAATLLNVKSWGVGGVTILWPSNGLLAGVLLTVPRRQWLSYLAVGFIVDFGINYALSDPAAYLASCNMIEVLLAAILLYPSIAPKPDLTRPKQLVNLLLYGVIVAPAVAAFLASFGTGGGKFFSGSQLHAFQWWFTADALGFATMTPLYLAFSQREGMRKRSWLEMGVLFTLVGCTALFVFRQTQYPVLFLLIPPLLLLGVRLGLAGSALGLLLVSIIGGFFTTAGSGPVTLMPNASLSARDLMFQFFIVIAMLMLYILEVVNAENGRLQQGMRASEMRFRLLTETSRDIIMLMDLEGAVSYSSPAVTEVLGWQPDEVLGSSYRGYFHPEDSSMFTRLLQLPRNGEIPKTVQYRNLKKDGSYAWLEANKRMFYDATAGDPVGLVAVMRDISSRKAAEEEQNQAFRVAKSLASVDGLTGIANRRRFDEVLKLEWQRALRERTYLSLLLMDVDHFKPFNDIYGHLSGDDCLRQIVEAVRDVVRRPADLLARYGGEEFAVILPNTNSYGASEIAEQIRIAVEKLRLPHTGNPHMVVTLSVGCATQMLEQDSSLTGLLQVADSALYQAKDRGRNRIEA
jgi:diguanylate cyclase (GGDEF)-like protein/PAS domain S-box-containing protein